MDFPARLKFLRLRAGLSQEQLAEALGSGQSRVSNYESGVREPSLSELLILANTLRVHVAELFENASKMPESASHFGGITAPMLAESITALRQVAKNQGIDYDPATHPEVTLYTLELRLELPATPSTADVIDFGAKVAERLRLATGGGADGHGESERAGENDRKRTRGRDKA